MIIKCETYYCALMHFLLSLEIEAEFTKRLNDYRWLSIHNYVKKYFCDDNHGIEDVISMAFPFPIDDISTHYRWCSINRKWKELVLNNDNFKSISKDFNTTPKSRFKSIW